MSWTWDNDYRNLKQVEEFYPAYLAIYEPLRAAGQTAYNDLFKGRIPGIEGPREDTAIYLLPAAPLNTRDGNPDRRAPRGRMA